MVSYYLYGIFSRPYFVTHVKFGITTNLWKGNICRPLNDAKIEGMEMENKLESENWYDRNKSSIVSIDNDDGIHTASGG